MPSSNSIGLTAKLNVRQINRSQMKRKTNGFSIERWEKRREKTNLYSSFLMNSTTMSFSGWIWSIFMTRQMKGVGLRLPPKVPPSWSSSIALSTKVSAVRPKHWSFQYVCWYIFDLTIFSTKFCGFVPCMLFADGSVRFAISLETLFVPLLPLSLYNGSETLKQYSILTPTKKVVDQPKRCRLFPKSNAPTFFNRKVKRFLPNQSTCKR